MTARNIEPDKKTTPDRKKPTSSDALIKGDKGKPELSENELNDVSGGYKPLNPQPLPP